jgi:hypothetical protein
MKTLKCQSLMIVAAIGLSVQANYGADSLSPLGTSSLAASGSSLSVPGGVGSVVGANVAISGSIPTYSNPNQNFGAAAANNVAFNNPVGAEPLSIPEPTTLALTGFCGLIALIFARRFGKTHRA